MPHRKEPSDDPKVNERREKARQAYYQKKKDIDLIANVAAKKVDTTPLKKCETEKEVLEEKILKIQKDCAAKLEAANSQVKNILKNAIVYKGKGVKSRGKSVKPQSKAKKNIKKKK
jgi:uncharacterized protein YlaN (UPF0358 family)